MIEYTHRRHSDRPTPKRSSIRSTASASWAAASRCSSRTPSRRTSRPMRRPASAGRCSRGRCSSSRPAAHQSRATSSTFPTKRHWRGKSRIEDIDAGLEALVAEIRERGIRSIAIPPLGCGLGGLNWADVRPRIERRWRGLPDVERRRLRAERVAPDARPKHPSDVPKMTRRASGAGRADASVPRRADGPVRDAARSAQAHVLHAGSRRAAEAPVT